VGEPTLRDILQELKKPGRDPRESFEPPKFREDVTSLADLKPGMVLEGVVTNVTAFGAFVDVGVHQDGLVHISQLADRFVRDPKEVVQVGQKLQVRVLEVDLPRKRIALSARLQERAERPAPAKAAGDGREGGGDRGERGSRKPGERPAPRGAATPSNGKAGAKQDKFTHNPFAKLLKS
jgi:uncharacterized protein